VPNINKVGADRREKQCIYFCGNRIKFSAKVNLTRLKNTLSAANHIVRKIFLLQRTVGNQAVQRALLARAGECDKGQAGYNSPGADFIQREEAGAWTTCSITAKRETTRPRFCINGTTNAPDRTRVSFHYPRDLRTMPPFGRATVQWRPVLLASYVNAQHSSWRRRADGGYRWLGPQCRSLLHPSPRGSLLIAS